MFSNIKDLTIEETENALRMLKAHQEKLRHLAVKTEFLAHWFSFGEKELHGIDPTTCAKIKSWFIEEKGSLPDFCLTTGHFNELDRYSSFITTPWSRGGKRNIYYFYDAHSSYIIVKKHKPAKIIYKRYDSIEKVLRPPSPTELLDMFCQKRTEDFFKELACYLHAKAFATGNVKTLLQTKYETCVERYV